MEPKLSELQPLRQEEVACRSHTNGLRYGLVCEPPAREPYYRLTRNAKVSDVLLSHVECNK